MEGGLQHCTGGSAQDHPQEKEMQKGKWLSEEALQIAEKGEAKGKGEEERYTHLNAEVQRIARKAFLSLLAILWDSAFKWLYLSFSSFHSYL